MYINSVKFSARQIDYCTGFFNRYLINIILLDNLHREMFYMIKFTGDSNAQIGERNES